MGQINFKSTAFTLAEVLITLTIIGVIAVLTIPNLMQSWRKHQVEVGLKEAYSILNNALKMAQTEGTLDELIGYTNQQRGNYHTAFKNHILPYLKADKVCRPSWDDVGWDWSIPASCQKNWPNGVDLYAFDKTTKVTSVYYGYTVFLSNGMIIYTTTISNSKKTITFYVDINGKKGPNLYGNDIHAFSIEVGNRTDSCNYSGMCKDILYGGYNGREATLWYGIGDGGINSVKCTASKPGWCTTVIQKNGWKIPDDYPVKKW